MASNLLLQVALRSSTILTGPKSHTSPKGGPVRCGHADRRQSSHRGASGLSRAGRLVAALGYPAPQSAIRQRLTRLQSDRILPTPLGWPSRTNRSSDSPPGHIVHPIEEEHPAAQLIALVIAPRQERTGAGTALMYEFETWTRSNGARLALVNSGEQRRETHTFYEHRGYTSTGLRFNTTLPDTERKTSVPPGVGGFKHHDLVELVDNPVGDRSANQQGRS